MWIVDIYIERFGASKDLRITGLKPGMNVLSGPNEAGKSTLAEFIRSMLFGFRRKSTGVNLYEPIDGGMRAGSLTVMSNDDRRLRIERREKLNNKEGELIITDDVGNSVPSESLEFIREGLERSLYESLYAFDLDGIKHFDRETLKKSLVGVSLGSLAASPLEVAQLVAGKIKDLTRMSKDGSNSISAMHTRLVELNAQLKVLADNTQRYDTLVIRVKALQQQREELTNEIRLTEENLDEIAKRLALEDQWRGLQDLDKQIDQLADLRNFPEEKKAEFDSVIDQIARVKHTVREYDSEMSALEEKLQAIGDTDAPESPSPSPVDEVVAQRIARFNAAWKDKQNKIELTRQRLEEVQDRFHRLEDSIDIKSQALPELKAACKNFLKSDQRSLLNTWIEQESRAQQILGQLSSYEQNLAELTQEREDLEAAVAHMASDSRWNRAQYLAMAAFILAAIGAIGLGLILLSLPGINFLMAMVVGAIWVVVMLTVGIGSLLFNRSNRSRRESIEDELCDQIDQLQLEIQGMAKERSQLQTLLDDVMKNMQSQAKAALGQAQISREAVLEAERASLEAEQAYQKFHGMQEALKREQAELEVEGRRKKQLEVRLESSLAELTTAKKAWEKFLHDNSLTEDLEPETALNKLERLASKAKESRFEQESLKKSLEDLKHKREKDGERLRSLETWRDAILREVGVADEDLFQEKAAQQEKLRELEKQKKLVLTMLTTGTQSDENEQADVSRADVDWGALKQSQSDQQARLKAFKERLEEIASETGRVKQEIESLEANDETDRLLAEREKLTARFNNMVKKWMILRLAAELISETIGQYESSKQPELVQVASHLFDRITNGVYPHVRFPLTAGSIHVIQANGASLTDELLSRSTLEQLYLSLRLAHLATNKGTGSLAPMVLDDILVNFDLERASRTAEILTEFAQETDAQIVFLTCHPHIVELFPDRTTNFIKIQSELPLKTAEPTSKGSDSETLLSSS